MQRFVIFVVDPFATAFVAGDVQDGTYAIIHIGTGTGAVNGGKNCAYPCSNGLPCGADQHTEPKGGESTSAPRRCVKIPLQSPGAKLPTCTDARARTHTTITIMHAPNAVPVFAVLPAATSESSFQTFDQWRATAAGKVVGSTIHVSKTLDGPWTPLNDGLGECNNPAPWVHANGTIYCVCGASGKRPILCDDFFGKQLEVDLNSCCGCGYSRDLWVH